MEEYGLPERLFQTGYEPTGRKRINNYFTLRWIEVVKEALTNEQQEMLAESQFRQLMLMGSHTFSVMFAHQLLSRQLVTQKLYELWWLLAGKPVRYGIGEFALVTGLNCGSLPTPSLGGQPMGKGKKKGKAKAKQVGGDGVVWKSLFGREETITPDWIIARLGLKEKYKDEDTRLRLSLLLLVEGILCPTSGATQLRPEVVEMVGDISKFLEYPWGRESFALTVASGKIRSAGPLAQDTLAIQGFAHAIVLVAVCSCPQIIADPRLGEDLVGDDVPIEDVVDGVCARTVKINIVTVQTIELIGQAQVRSILYEGSDIAPFTDEVEDPRVNYMVSLIHDRFPFELNTWRGGVKASDAKQSKALGGSSSEGVGHTGSETEHGENYNREELPRGFDSGDRFDVSTIVRLVAQELHTRALPMVSTLKEGICAEIKSLKEVLLQSPTRESRGVDDPHRHWGVTPSAVSGMQRATGNGDQYRGSSLQKEFTTRSLGTSSASHVMANTVPPISPLPSSPLLAPPFGPGQVTPPSDVVPPGVMISTAAERDNAYIDGVLAELTGGSSPTAEEGDNEGETGAENLPAMQPELSVSHPPLKMHVEKVQASGLVETNHASEVAASEPASEVEALEAQNNSPVQTALNASHAASSATAEGHNEGAIGAEPIPASEVAASEPQKDSPAQTARNVSSVAEEPAPVEVPTDETVSVEVQTRTSKRARNPTVLYTPPAPPVKKQKVIKKGGARGKKGGARGKKGEGRAIQGSTDVPSIPDGSSGAVNDAPPIQSDSVVAEPKLSPITEKASSGSTTLTKALGSFGGSTKLTPTKGSGSFVKDSKVGPFPGEFFPCVRLNAFRLAGFCTDMHTQRDYDLGEGVIVDNKVFQSFFDAKQSQTPKAADMVITFIRRRLRQEGITAYDFLPACFVESLRGEYQQFCRVKDIANFSFSNIFANPGFPNMKWDEKVEVLYFPFQADGWHWIGVVVDIANWCIRVLDCNPSCLNDEKLATLLNPIVVLLPLLISRNGGKASSDSVMPIKRLDLPLLCEQRELSCIASILLMEMHATQNLAQTEHLNADSLANAAQSYAVEAFVTFNPSHLLEFPRV